MKPFRTGPIADVICKPMQPFHDERGWLCEMYRDDELPNGIAPRMAYLSETLPGVRRGPHEHQEQTDYFCFPGPSTFEIHLWDHRRSSPTYWCHDILFASVENPCIVIVPPGIVHAYRNVGTLPGLIVNLPNQLYRGVGKQNVVDEIRHENDADSPFRWLSERPGLRYRNYEARDLEPCMALLDANMEPYFSAYDVAAFRKFLNNIPGEYGVVELPSVGVIGCGGIAFRAAEADFTWGMIHPHYHRQGIGRFLLLERLRLLLDRPETIQVRMDTSQHTVGFYQKYGFVPVKQQANGYRDGLDRIDLKMPWDADAFARALATG